jgi:hypothetical protein
MKQKNWRRSISVNIYYDEFKYCSLSWFYTSIGNKRVLDNFTIVDDAEQEDKFMASLILAKEIANIINGKAVLRYDDNVERRK